MSANKLLSRFICMLSLQIILIISLSNCLSYMWGHLDPGAVRMYEIGFNVQRRSFNTLDSDKAAYIDIHYPLEGDKSKYIITMMMLSSESRLQQTNQLKRHEAKAVVISGGIGLNYTIVRLLDIRSETNVNFVVFGLPPYSYIV